MPRRVPERIRGGMRHIAGYVQEQRMKGLAPRLGPPG